MHAVLPGRRPGAGGGSRASRIRAQRDSARALARLPAAPRASGPSRLALHQRPRAPALLAASQWETCCQAESSFEWPNQAPQPEPLLIWGPGDELANPPPRHRRLPRPLPPRSTAHPRLRPRPLPLPRAERGKSAQRRAGGQTGGEGGEEPRCRERFQREEGRAAGVENSRQEAACRQRCPPTRPRSAASRLPRIPPGESQPACTGGTPGVLRAESSAPLPGHCPPEPQHRGAGLWAALDGAVRRLSGTRGAPPLPG